MERAPWFLDPEVLIFSQVAGVAVFLFALAITVLRRQFAPVAIGGKIAELRDLRVKESSQHLYESADRHMATLGEKFPGFAATDSAGGSLPGC